MPKLPETLTKLSEFPEVVDLPAAASLGAASVFPAGGAAINFEALLATFRCKIAASDPDYKGNPSPGFRPIEPISANPAHFFLENRVVCGYNITRAFQIRIAR